MSASNEAHLLLTTVLQLPLMMLLLMMLLLRSRNTQVSETLAQCASEGESLHTLCITHLATAASLLMCPCGSNTQVLLHRDACWDALC